MFISFSIDTTNMGYWHPDYTAPQEIVIILLINKQKMADNNQLADYIQLT